MFIGLVALKKYSSKNPGLFEEEALNYFNPRLLFWEIIEKVYEDLRLELREVLINVPYKPFTIVKSLGNILKKSLIWVRGVLKQSFVFF